MNIKVVILILISDSPTWSSVDIKGNVSVFTPQVVFSENLSLLYLVDTSRPLCLLVLVSLIPVSGHLIKGNLFPQTDVLCKCLSTSVNKFHVRV